MASSFIAQFYIIDPCQPPGKGTELKPVEFEISDMDGDNWIEDDGTDTVDGSPITHVWQGDTITIKVGGSGGGGGEYVEITGTTFYLENGQAVFTPTDGTILEDGKFSSSTYETESTDMEMSEMSASAGASPPCFTRTTLIETEKGPRPVEDIEVGDAVLTRDHGLQPVRWVSHRTISGRAEFSPVCFCKGALGNDRELRVSPQHRMLITGWRAEMLFGEPEVLVAAKHLINGDTIYSLPVNEIEYFHLMFDGHEIVTSEGIPSESFDPDGEFAHQDRATRSELFALFPELRRVKAATARPALRGYEARLLFA